MDEILHEAWTLIICPNPRLEADRSAKSPLLELLQKRVFCLLLLICQYALRHAYGAAYLGAKYDYGGLCISFVHGSTYSACCILRHGGVKAILAGFKSTLSDASGDSNKACSCVW